MATSVPHSITVNQVRKRYDNVLALDQVSLSIHSAKTTVLIGPSGCGKSTLLKMINGLERPDQGSINIDNQTLDYHHLSAIRRRIGYGVQQTGLFPHLTIVENISLLAKIEHWTPIAIDQRLQTLLQLTALDATLLQRYPHQLSGGQQQRAGLCRTLMIKPDFLLLDEPFGAVDPITRLDIQQQFLQLQQAEPRTTLLVTHDINEALILADHIVVMYAGKIIDHQPVQAYSNLTNPQNTLLEMIRHGSI